MPATPIGQRVRARPPAILAAAAALALTATVGCTTGTAIPNPSQRPSQGPGPVVTTADGAVRGKTVAGIGEYLGIPYAAAPVGALRWRPPQPPEPWTGTREATSYAPHCPQPTSAFGRASTSEDCLYLNVFTPAGNHSRALPVMVWVHGGSLRTGESDDYNPAGLVRHGVVVVTINYRIGALGFLAEPALAGHPGAPSGNYGLMDQQAALRWVQHNIRGFGGDPGQVTLFGESAGGLSTLAQLISPGTRGLFRRAIVESGTYDLTLPSLAAAESAGQAFAAKAGCASTVSARDVAACLRRLPVSTILSNQNPVGYTPDVDGAVLTQSVKTALARGQFNYVPVVIGTNHDEYRLFVAVIQFLGGRVTAANYQTMIASTLSLPATAASAAAAQYPLSRYPSPPVALGAVATDAIFACHALTAEESLSRYVPVYAYEFNDENAPELFLPPVGFPYGAAHASELPYLFSQATVAHPASFSAAQQQLAAAMKQYWTGLARTGVPAAGWPRFSRTSQQVLSLVPPRPRVETDFAAQHHCAFWSAHAVPATG
jgi:para-nitrobenzyl esterase